GYNDKPIELTKDDLFFLNKTKMNGIIFDYLKDSNIKIEPQLLESLKELKKFNYIRNINLLKKAINIDFYLEENGIKRVWIKGDNDKPIELTKDDLFFLNKTKMNGIIFDYLKDSNIKIEPQLLESLKELKKFNYIRNINLLKKAINIDFYLEENGIKRVWIK